MSSTYGYGVEGGYGNQHVVGVEPLPMDEPEYNHDGRMVEPFEGEPLDEYRRSRTRKWLVAGVALFVLVAVISVVTGVVVSRKNQESRVGRGAAIELSDPGTSSGNAPSNEGVTVNIPIDDGVDDFPSNKPLVGDENENTVGAPNEPAEDNPQGPSSGTTDPTDETGDPDLGDSETGDSETGDSETGDSDPAVILEGDNNNSGPSFQADRVFIELICGEKAETLDDCKQECSGVPECCSLDDETGCLNDNLAGCVDYARCHVIASDEETGGTDPGAAPDNLSVICDEDNGAAYDATACAAACSAVSCCYTDGENCPSWGWILTCLDYAPCQALRVEADPIPDAPSTLSQDCDPFNGNQSACEEACAVADCCAIGAENSCLADNFFTCLGYASCNFLPIQNFTNSLERDFPRPEADFDGSCSLDLLMDGIEADRIACETACEASSCCRATGDDEEENCFFDNIFQCLEWSSCSVLDVTGGSVPAAPDDLGEICGLSTFETGGEAAIDRCREQCELADCCFTTIEGQNCFADNNAMACLGYTLPCAILLLVDRDIDMPPGDVDDKCALVDENPALCREACEPASCCWNTDDLVQNCFAQNIFECLAWSVTGCLNLPDEEGDAGLDTGVAVAGLP